MLPNASSKNNFSLKITTKQKNAERDNRFQMRVVWQPTVISITAQQLNPLHGLQNTKTITKTNQSSWEPTKPH